MSKLAKSEQMKILARRTGYVAVFQTALASTVIVMTVAARMLGFGPAAAVLVVIIGAAGIAWRRLERWIDRLACHVHENDEWGCCACMARALRLHLPWPAAIPRRIDACPECGHSCCAEQVRVVYRDRVTPPPYR